MCVDGCVGENGYIDSACLPFAHHTRTDTHVEINKSKITGGEQGPRGHGNHSALGARFFHDEGFIVPHSGPGALFYF